MTIAAIVVTYNRKDLLTECMEHLLGQTRKVDSIIVIDNASTDDTGKLFETGAVFDKDNVDYRLMSENLGGAGGFYEGVRYAYHKGFDWIWIMDDDTIPDTDALEAFCNAMKYLPENVSYLASAVYGMNGEAMNVPVPDSRPSDSGYPDWYRYSDKGLIKILNATFVSIMVSSAAVKKVGLPYKKFFIWGDDKEYTLRLTKYYGPAFMVGDSRVLHKRKIVKPISIKYEDDPKRIDQFYYNYRNILINDHEYVKGARSVLSRIFHFETMCLRILFDKKSKYRWKKVWVVQKGIFGYLSGDYDRKAFKERFKI